MPKINHQSIDDVKQDGYTQIPVFVAGLTRKLNLGNYESLDISASVSLPMPDARIGEVDIDILRQVIQDTASEAFSLVSQEVTKRCNDIKQMRSADRGRQIESAE